MVVRICTLQNEKPGPFIGFFYRPLTKYDRKVIFSVGLSVHWGREREGRGSPSLSRPLPPVPPLARTGVPLLPSLSPLPSPGQDRSTLLPLSPTMTGASLPPLHPFPGQDRSTSLPTQDRGTLPSPLLPSPTLPPARTGVLPPPLPPAPGRLCGVGGMPLAFTQDFLVKFKY